MRTQKKPAAFFSYVIADDKYGHLTQLRERLSDEVQMQTGAEFPIFQDRNDIEWGQNWQQRLEQAVQDEVTFLIPIITPSFFTRDWCRRELQLFVDREKDLGRNDLILPIYYIRCPLLEDEEGRCQDPLAQVIHERQRADWRHLRFEPFTSPQVGKTLETLALQISKALERLGAPRQPTLARPPDQKQKESTALNKAPVATQQAETLKAPPVIEPPTHVVDALYRGDFPLISQAIQAAKPGDRILVRPGFYSEGLVIDKPLEIIGDGEVSEIIVQASGRDVILFQTTMGRVANMTLHQKGPAKFYAVNITQGRLELEGCDITSQGLACVAIHDGADPRLRRNRIHDGKQAGIYVYDNGQGILEDNDIFGNAFTGVEIKGGSNPTLRRNRIHDGKSGGVLVYDNGQGILEDNDVFGNALAGIAIKGRGNPTLRHNRIHDGKRTGVYIYDNGQGVLEDNDILGNARAGIWIQEGSKPVARNNRVNKNGDVGVYVARNSGGTFEENDLRDNLKGAWNISGDSKANVKRARNQE